MKHGCVYEHRNNLIDNYFLNPFNYPKLSQLTQTSLNIFTGELNPFLDESVILAKRWKGKVAIKIFPDLGHAQHYLGVINQHAHEAEVQFIDLIRSSLQ